MAGKNPPPPRSLSNRAIRVRLRNPATPPGGGGEERLTFHRPGPVPDGEDFDSLLTGTLMVITRAGVIDSISPLATAGGKTLRTAAGDASASPDGRHDQGRQDRLKHLARKHLRDIFPAPFCNARLLAVAHALREKTPQQIEESLEPEEGKCRRYTTELIPLADSGGRFTRVVLLSRPADPIIGTAGQQGAGGGLLLEGQERERKRIACELHDGICQSLITLKLELRLILDSVEPGQAALRRKCLDALENVAALVGETRRISWNLMPVALETLGLAGAIRLLAAGCAARTGVAVKTGIEGEEVLDALPNEAALHIFRIFQELVTNVERHANARTLSLSCGPVDDRTLRLEVRDDGIGLEGGSASSPAAAHSGKHEGRQEQRLPAGSPPPFAAGSFGFHTLQERTRLLGGTLTVESRPGSGTVVRIEMPLGDQRR